MAKKLAEVNMVINHNTDGLEMPLTLTQAQADDNTAKITSVDTSVDNTKEAVQELTHSSQHIDGTLHEKMEKMQGQIYDLQDENETLKGIV